MNGIGVGIPFYRRKFVLEKIQGAVGAFSLKKLSHKYTGPCLRVRRDSDNIEKDIYFHNKYLDTTSLLNFTSSSNGYIAKWFDQSGNNNDMIQTSEILQPIVVNNGTLLNDVRWDAVDDRLIIPTLENTNFPQSEFTIFIKDKANGSPSDGGLFSKYYSGLINTPFFKHNGSNNVNFRLAHTGGSYNNYTSNNNSVIQDEYNTYAMAVKTGLTGNVKYFLNENKLNDTSIENGTWTPNQTDPTIYNAAGGITHNLNVCLIFNRQITDAEYNLLRNHA